MKRAVSVLVAALFGLTACSSDNTTTITVSAAASLTDSFIALGAAFEHLELELVIEIEGRPEAVKPWPEIGRCCGDIHHHGGANLRFSHQCALGGSARY